MEKIKVLYIEDEDQQREEFSKLLEGKGFSVEGANSGESGLQKFREQGVDLILCDLNMTGMNGIEVLYKVKEVDPDVPFILLTSHGSVSLAVKAMQQGAHDFLLKPLDVDEAEITIRQAIEKKKLKEDLKSSEDTLAMILENVPEIIYALGPTGEFTSLSKATESVLGYKPEELIGKPVFDVIYPDDQERVRKGFKQATKTGEKQIKTLEFRMVSKSGEVKDFEIRRKFYFDGGKVVRNIGVAFDITERKKIEEQLKKRSQELENRVQERTESLEYANRQLAALNGVANRFSLIYDEESLFDELPALLTQSLDFDRAVFILRENGALKLRSYDFGEESLDDFQQYLDLINKKEVEPPGYVKKLMETDDTVFIKNVSEDPNWSKENFKDIPFTSLISSPIKVKGKTIGYLEGDMQYHKREMDSQDIARFEMFTNMVGLALDNIRVYQNLEKRVEKRTEELKEKAKELQQATYDMAHANIELLGVQEQLEEKNAEMEKLLLNLSQSKDELQAILDVGMKVILMVNMEGKITATNREIERYFNLNEKAVIGKSFRDIINKIVPNLEDPKNFKALVDELIAKPDSPNLELWDLEQFLKRSFKLIRPQERYISVVSFSVMDKTNKNSIGSVWAFTDITKFKEADEQLRAIVEVSPIPYIISRIDDGRILYVNKSLSDLIGLPASKLIGQKTPDFYADPEERKIIIEKVNKEGQLFNYDVQIKKATGDTFWMIMSIVTSEINSVPVTVVALYDITERKQAEEALERAHKIYQDAIENVEGVPYLKKYDKNEYEYIGDGVLNLLGITEKDMTGEKMRQLTKELYFVDPNAPQDPVEYDKAFKRGKVDHYRVDIKIVTEEGKEKWVSDCSVPVRDEQTGKVIGSLGILQDITERKEFAEALRVSEERFRSLVENAHDIIFSLNPDGTFSYISPQFKEYTGYEINDFIGKTFEPLLHPDEVLKGREIWQDVEGKKEDQTDYEFRIKTKAGDFRWFVTHSTLIRDEHGDVIEAVGIAHDVTEIRNVLNNLKRTNKELRATQSQLVQSEKMAALGMLVAGIAHEINTPVGAINSMYGTSVKAIEKLKTELDLKFGDSFNENKKLTIPLKIIEDANRVIQSGSERVTKIVRRLRSFARLDEADLKEVDIHEGIEDTLTIIHHEIKHKITVHKDFSELPGISCYPGRLNQVFLNLLINGNQAIADKGEITISTFTKNNYVYIAIKDTGKGISGENIKKVFDPGFTTKGVGVGTGLGLSICYQIIRDHQGEILVESEVGKGSTFTVVFPMDLDKRIDEMAEKK